MLDGGIPIAMGLALTMLQNRCSCGCGSVFESTRSQVVAVAATQRSDRVRRRRERAPPARPTVRRGKESEGCRQRPEARPGGGRGGGNGRGPGRGCRGRALPASSGDGRVARRVPTRGRGAVVAAAAVAAAAGTARGETKGRAPRHDRRISLRRAPLSRWRPPRWTMRGGRDPGPSCPCGSRGSWRHRAVAPSPQGRRAAKGRGPLPGAAPGRPAPLDASQGAPATGTAVAMTDAELVDVRAPSVEIAGPCTQADADAVAQAQTIEELKTSERFVRFSRAWKAIGWSRCCVRREWARPGRVSGAPSAFAHVPSRILFLAPARTDRILTRRYAGREDGEKAPQELSPCAVCWSRLRRRERDVPRLI